MASRFTWIDLAVVAPLLIVLAGALLILLIESFSLRISKFYLTLFTLFAAIGVTFYGPEQSSALMAPWIRSDLVSHFFSYFFLATGIGCTLLAESFFQRFTASRGEYYFLLLSCIFGLILIADAADFLTLFLGLETLSISLYVLCGYMKNWELSHESAMKYFFLGSFATAILLYGIALLYGAAGTTHLASLAASEPSALFLGGIALVTLGLAFKAAIVPFHAWAPDVYDGAPNPVTAFMAVATKAGAFAAFILVFLVALPKFDLQPLSILAYATLIYANFLALQQTQLRRFFAYSGISHAGFLLLPLIAGGPDAIPAMEFYLAIYALATLGAFAVFAYLDTNSEGPMLNDLQGLWHRSPFLAAVMALCLLTLAGIPPTAGFFAKFYVFKVTFEAGYYGLVIVGLLTTILSAYYYLRILFLMGKEGNREPIQNVWPAGLLAWVTAAGIAALTLFPGLL